MPKVFNQHRDGRPLSAVYVGRPTKWGNPYTHLKSRGLAEILVGSREEAVQRYKDDLLKRRTEDPQWFADFIRPLRGKNLVCWCAPLPCHADILLELANE